MSITMKREIHDNVVLLQLQGDLGKPEAEQLKNELRSLLDSGRRYFILDLEEVRYVDSYAIMVLLRSNREALGAGGEIKLLRPRHVVKRFLDIGKVLELFDRFESKIEAIKAFQKKAAANDVKPLDPLKATAQSQKQIVMKLAEILLKKDLFTMNEFHREMNRSSQLVLEIFRKEIKP